MSEALKINPEALRVRSRDIPDCSEITGSNNNTTVSFVVGEQSQDLQKLARVTVYCGTGTVAIGRILNGAMRQTFRRNVTSLDVLERMLRQPPLLIQIDSSLVSLQDDEEENRTNTLQEGNDTQISEKARFAKSVRTNMELIDVGVAILQGEREKLAQHVHSLESPQRSTSISGHVEGSSSTSTDSHSIEFQFSLPQESMKHVDKCLEDISKMGRLVRHVSTNGRGTVFLYGNGGVAFTPAIPRALYHKLSQLRRNNTVDSRPAYISLGTRDRFFMAFHDNTFAIKGPKGLERELKKVKDRPHSVAFGVAYDTFFIVFHDGSWYYQGRGIPKELEEKLVARRNRSDLVCVNLGPSGEWFLRARNGRLWWGGISDEMDSSIQHLLESGHYLNFLDFGEDGSYFISYD